MQNTVIENIRLELNKPRVKSSISVRRGDTATRTIHVTLTNNGCVYELGNALIAQIIVEKPDGTKCYNNCVISGNEIQYTITSQTINVAGECICQVEVTFEDGAVVTSPEFSIMVYEQMGSRTDVMSRNEYTALTQQVVMARNYSDGAATSEKNAAVSEQNAATSETNALQAAENAAASEANALQSAENAAASEVNALRSAENAALSAENATLSAENATLSAENATLSAENATLSAENATLSAENATLSEKNATLAAENAALSEKKAALSEAAALSAMESAKDAERGAQKCYEDFKASGQLVLGDKHDTAFYGDQGKVAYEHSLVIMGNPHHVTYADVGAEKEGLASECYQNAVAYTDLAIANLINGAPETLDTLKEIADAMSENASVVEAIDKVIGTKAEQVELDTHMENEVIHITTGEREKWNAYEARLQELEALLVSYGYPVSVEIEE